MPQTFTASLLTSGNTIFPVKVTIDDRFLTCNKGFIVGRSYVTVPLSSISSVSLINRIIFSDLIVETRGGRSLHLTGFTHRDARDMYRLLNNIHQ